MRPRIPQLALVQCAMALVLMLLGTPAVEASMPRFLPPGPPPPPASMSTHWLRYDGSDTLNLSTSVFFSETCEGWSGEWRILLPEGLELVEGRVEGSGLTSLIKGLHIARVRCTRWGTFVIRGWFRTGLDSLNWTSHNYQVEVRATPDSFEYRHLPSPPLNVTNWKHVLGGIHHRSTGWVWLPLDPGESETVEPGFDERNQKAPPPALHKASGAVAGAVTQDSVVSMPVLVAVARDGTVKDVYTHIRGVHNAVLAAAIEAARRWTFTPAKSFGQPASALYEIRVPVRAPLAIARKHRF